MGRIIPYIMENQKCPKPPTSKILVSPKDIFRFMESSTWIPRLPRDIICTSSSLLAMAALLSHRKMLSRKCHCWEPVSNRKHQERKSFERLEQWFILKTVCKLSPSFLLCGCLFASFCYQSQSLKLFGGCLGLEKRGRERPTWKSVTLSSGFGCGLGHSLVFPSWLEHTNQLYSLQMDVRWCDRVWVKLGYLTKLGFVPNIPRALPIAPTIYRGDFPGPSLWSQPTTIPRPRSRPRWAPQRSSSRSPNPRAAASVARRWWSPVRAGSSAGKGAPAPAKNSAKIATFLSDFWMIGLGFLWGISGIWWMCKSVIRVLFLGMGDLLHMNGPFWRVKVPMRFEHWILVFFAWHFCSFWVNDSRND